MKNFFLIRNLQKDATHHRLIFCLCLWIGALFNPLLVQAKGGKKLLKPTPMPALSFDPGQLNFEVDFNAGSNATQTAELTASEGSAEFLSIEQPLNATWLILPTTPTLGSLEFGVDAKGLLPGTYQAVVKAQAPDYETGELVVILKVNPLPLTFSANLLSFSADFGQNPSAQNSTLSVDSGSPQVTLTRPSNAAWLQLPDPALGNLSFQVNTEGLAPGIYQTQVSARARGYEQATLDVELEVKAPSDESNFEWLYQVNFQPASSTPPNDYIVDQGEAYDDRGNGFVYGWLDQINDYPRDLAELRDRNIFPAELSTLALMQTNDGKAWYWEFNLPPDLYRVRVAVGDPQFKDSKHLIRAEGREVITLDQNPAGAPSSAEGTIIVPVLDGKLTIDAIGGENTKINYVWIGRVDATQDNFPPVLEVAFNGEVKDQNTFLNQVRIQIDAKDLGASGISTVEYSLNGNDFQAYAQSILLNEVGAYTLEARATDQQGNSSTSAVYDFHVIQEGTKRPKMVLQNLDAFPENDELTFSRIQVPWRGSNNNTPVNGNHDLVTLRIFNRGVDNLYIEDLLISNSDYWQIRSVDDKPFQASQDLPITITPDTYQDILVAFVAVDPPVEVSRDTLIQVLHETLTIVSNDPKLPRKEVKLHGLWQQFAEFDREPNINEILDAYGYKTVSGFETRKNGTNFDPTGDEVVFQFLERVDPSQPVYVRQLASYHGCCNQAENIRYNDVNPEAARGGTIITRHDPVDAQSLLPRANTNVQGGIYGTPAEGTFVPNGLFSLTVLNDCTNYELNPKNNAGQIQIGVRAWRLRNSRGQIVPNTFIISNDYLGTPFTNYDYNDNTYVISNVRPVDNTGYEAKLRTGTQAAPQSSLEFGENNVENDQATSLTVRNAGLNFPLENDPDVEISAVEIVGQNADDFWAEMPAESRLDPQESSSMQVHFQPRTVGLKQATLLIHYNSGDSPLQVPLFGVASSDCYQAQLVKRIKAAVPNANPVTIAGQAWESDESYRVGSGFKLDNVDDVSSQIQATEKDALYRSYMSSVADFTPISYEITVPNGTYTLRLHFAENFFDESARRINHVQMEGAIQGLGIDIFQEVGFKTALVRDYEVEVTDGALNLDFLPLENRPAICGFELYRFTPNQDIVISQSTSPDCFGDNGVIEVNMNGALAYKLGQGGTYQANGRFTDLAAGTYQIYARNNNGCETIESFQLESAASPFTFELETQPVSCGQRNDGQAAVVNLSGGQAPYQVIWDDNERLSGFAVRTLSASAGHFVTVTDASGCSKTLEFSIGQEADCPLRINAGGDDQIYVSVAGNEFSRDQFSTGGNTSFQGNAIANTEDDRLYQTYRWWNQDVNYNIPVSSGSYQVRLHFAETFNNDPGNRRFNIDIEGERVRSNFDAFTVAGAKNRAVIESFDVQVNDGTLNVLLDRIDNPAISALEVIRTDTPEEKPFPYLVSPFVDQSVSIDTTDSFDFNIALDAFVDPDGAPLTMSAFLAGGAPLPEWLTFNASTGAFSATLTPSQLGVHFIQVRAVDTAGQSVSDVFKLDVNSDEIVSSVEEVFAPGLFTLYPNPFVDRLELGIAPSINTQASIYLEVVSLQGSQLVSQEMQVKQLQEQLNQALSRAPRGIYLVKLYWQGAYRSYKIIKR